MTRGQTKSDKWRTVVVVIGWLSFALLASALAISVIEWTEKEGRAKNETQITGLSQMWESQKACSASTGWDDLRVWDSEVYA